MQTGDSQVVGLLLLYGADTDIVDNYGAMPSDYAAQIGDSETQLLLLNSANERAANASPEWVECFDDESGYPFWVNTTTGETEVGGVRVVHVYKSGQVILAPFSACFAALISFSVLLLLFGFFCVAFSSGATKSSGRKMKLKCHKPWK